MMEFLTANHFQFGPYWVSKLNIIIIAVLIYLSIKVRRIVQRLLKKYLSEANIRLDTKRETYLRILSQLVYVLAAYLSFLSFKINNGHNPGATFANFLTYKFIKTSKIELTFENLVLAVGIFFGAKVALNIVQLYLQRRFKKEGKLSKGREFVALQVAKYIIYTIAIIGALGALNVEPSLFLGGSAALLVGLGLGLQDVFKDMFSGFVLLFEGSIRVGDVIEMHDGKSSESIVAKVLKINIRTAQIQTRDGNVLIVPNTKLTQEYIENWSHGSTLSRFRINLTVHYGTDLELVKSLLEQAAKSHPKVNKEERIEVRLNDFSENGLQMELIFWADQNWDINSYKSEIRYEIDLLFRQNNIHIPYPQREVLVRN
jgi:small-conductance mechanosensitive channel